MMVLNLFRESNIYYKKMAKHKKHDKIISDYSSQKSKHLEKLATQLLKQDEINQKLKEKSINPNFLNLF